MEGKNKKCTSFGNAGKYGSHKASYMKGMDAPNSFNKKG